MPNWKKLITSGSDALLNTVQATSFTGSLQGNATTATSASYALSASYAPGGGVTINNNTDNYLVTATGTANTLNGEANLTFDGTYLKVGSGASTNSTLSIKGANISGTTTGRNFLIENSNGDTVMEFRNATYAFLGCGQSAGAHSGLIIRYDSTSYTQILGYNYSNGYKPILLDTDSTARSKGIFINFDTSGTNIPPTVTEFAVRGQGSSSGTYTARFYNAGNTELFQIRDDGQSFVYGLTLGRGPGNNSGNAAFGYLALNSNTTGVSLVAIGARALQNNTSGANNTALGSEALINVTTGGNNTGIGASALTSLVSGNNNIGIGLNSGYGITGTGNIAIGAASLFQNTGNYNTAVGYYAGFSNVSGTGNVFIGNEAGRAETGSNKLYIANANNSKPLIGGDFSTGRVGINTNAPIVALDVKYTGSYAAGLLVENGNATAGVGAGSLSIRQGSSGGVNISATTTGIYIYDVNNSTTTMTFNSTGVGIFNTSPSHALTVTGAVSASTYYGDGSNLTGISGGGSTTSFSAPANTAGITAWSLVTGTAGRARIEFYNDNGSGTMGGGNVDVIWDGSANAAAQGSSTVDIGGGAGALANWAASYSAGTVTLTVDNNDPINAYTVYLLTTTF